MSHLTLVSPGPHRKTLALGKCAEKDYPKKSPDIAVTVDGKPETMRVTSSRVFSTGATTGCNAYIRLNGFVAWVAFDHGYTPVAGLKFTFAEGAAPDANPKREPKNPKSEAARVEKFKDWAAGRSKIAPVLGGETVTEV